MLILKYSTYILLILSGLTLLTKAALAVLKLGNITSPIASKVEAVAGALAAALVVWQVGFSGARLARHDEGADHILEYYRDVREGNFDSAWKLIHPARQEELKARGWTGPADLRASYNTTVEYGTITADLDRQDSGARLYWVTLDVKDRLPRSTTFALYAHEPLRRAVDDGLLSRQKLLHIILTDLQRDYDLPENQVSKVEEYVLGSPLDAVFGPKTVIDVATSLKLKRRHFGSELDIWTHYIQYLTMLDDGGWKIRQGLWPPTLEAYYPPGARVR